MDTRESQALILGSDSETETELVEFSQPGRRVEVTKNGRSTTRHRLSSKSDQCCCENPCHVVLAISLLLNVVLIGTLLVISLRRGLAACPQLPNLHDILDTFPSISTTPCPSLNEHLIDKDGPKHDVSSRPPLPFPDGSAPGPTDNSMLNAMVTTDTPTAGESSSPQLSPACECSTPSTCGTGTLHVAPPVDKKYVNIFQDLSAEEISIVAEFLYQQEPLSLNRNGNAGNVIFGIEVNIPTKILALEFLDRTGAIPAREALVTIELHGEEPEVVREYVVGPLPHPTYYRANERMSKNVPMKYHGMYLLREVYSFLMMRIVPKVDHVIRESFGVAACRQTESDDKRCLMFLTQKVNFALVNRTTFVFSSYYNTEFPTIQPVAFQLIIQERSFKHDFEVHSIFYAGKAFGSLEQFLSEYAQDAIPKISRKFLENAPGEDSIPGSMNSRGNKFPETPHAGPRQFEPNGPRYSIVEQHVKYLKWSFNVRMSIESGPQLWDVRWADERIVYELSLQEVVVLYAGANPSAMLSHLSDSAFGLGDAAHRLVPGVDCPEHATFLNSSVFLGIPQEGLHTKELPNAVCVFEHNSGVPLRRHSSEDNGRQYGGLVDNVLIVRSILVEYNYDYIFDIVFHNNGALEIRVYATGYIMSQWYYPGEDPFGFRVHEDVVGSVHHHLFHFKIDMDVGGVNNRYETLNMDVDKREWPWLSGFKSDAFSSNESTSLSPSASSSQMFSQIAFKHHLRGTEKDAVYHYNFEHPKYHIFYNDQNRNKFYNPRAYRLSAHGFSKQMLPNEHPAISSRKWAQHQIVVTKQKEGEHKSSSIFSMYDGEDPVVNFDTFYEDDEDIVDKDLVGWVSLGMHHIPHSEDIPNTPTVGTEANILFLPYNYFPEDPSVASRDAVRADFKDGVTTFNTYGSATDFNCTPPIYGKLNDSRSTSYP